MIERGQPARKPSARKPADHGHQELKETEAEGEPGDVADVDSGRRQHEARDTAKASMASARAIPVKYQKLIGDESS